MFGPVVHGKGNCREIFLYLEGYSGERSDPICDEVINRKSSSTIENSI